jgi:hypothetical protein
MDADAGALAPAAPGVTARAGVVNVTASPQNSATLTQVTSQQYEVFGALLATGLISTYTIDNNSTIISTNPATSTTIKNGIASSGAALDSLTGLFDAPNLIKIINVVGPGLQRTVNVTPSSNTPGSVVLLRDYTNPSELNLASNTYISVSNFFVDVTSNGSQVLKVGAVVGGGFSGCGGMLATIVAHTVPNIEIAPYLVSACILPNPTGGVTTVRNVYSGNMLVGATNNAYPFGNAAPPPYTGGWLALAGGAPGTASATVPVASTSFPVVMNDPAGFAFGFGYANKTFSIQTNFANTPLSQTTFTTSNYSSGWRGYMPANYASAHNSVSVDTFNPWRITQANVAICAGVNCYALTATQPFAISRPFSDPGTKLAYFNWVKGGVVTGISQGAGAYNVTTSGAGSGTLTSTTATVFTPQQQIQIVTSLPAGTIFTITGKDAALVVYSNSGVCDGYSANIVMSSVGNITNITNTVITFHSPAASTYTIGPIGGV